MRTVGLLAILFSSLFSVAQPVDLKSGLVAYYPFNGNANDESGNGNHGVVRGATLTADRLNNLSSAYRFVDSTYIELPPNTYIYGNFTIALWVNVKQRSTWGRIIEFGSGPWTNNVAISSSFESSDKPCLSLCNKNICNNIVTETGLEPDRWVFLCVTLKNSHVEFYKNGKLWLRSLNGVIPQPELRSMCYIGKSSWPNNLNKEVLIDDIRVYNRVLSEAEIIALSNLSAKETNGKSEVDLNIPVNATAKANTYALIIGNEDYSSSQTDINAEVNVEFAENDARVFREYCVKTLGIPEKNVTLLVNATGSRMMQNLDLISKIAKASEGKAELIFYYAGHGLPHEQTKEPYLIPVDVNGTDLTYAVKLADVYKKLTENPAIRVTAFIDACFSGGARNQGLVALRGVKVRPKEELVGSNLVVFTSSSGDESSAAYKEMKHGLFTYYLLKKLQITKGSCTYAELDEYLRKEVSVTSLVVNKRQQTPQVVGGPEVGDRWKEWTIK